MSILNSNNFLYRTVDGVKQFFSPLVNASTVILKDGSRLEKDGKVYADQAVNAETLGGKEPKYYIQPRNLLDNSNFRNPVNQRGLESYTGYGYTIDRWVSYSPTGTVAVTVGSNGIIVNPGADGEASFTQRFPADSLTDGDYTFAWMDGSGVVRIDNNPITIQGDIKYVGVVLNSETTIVWAALYEGEYTAENLPPYVPKGYDIEYLTCRRWFLPFPRWTFVFFCGSTTAYSDAMISYGIPMYPIRTVNLALGGVSGWYSVVQASNSVRLRVDINTGWPNGYPIDVSADGCYISAEL